MAHAYGTGFRRRKRAGNAVLEDPQMPVTSTLLDQAHNAINRKLFMMKAFHHPDGSQQAFLVGLAHLYNLVPYQRRGPARRPVLGWKSKEAESPHATGCSISKYSRLEAFDEL